MLQVDPEFLKGWRESVFPGGCAHAGELETSMLLYLSPESVRQDKIKSEIARTNQLNSKYMWTDLFSGRGTSRRFARYWTVLPRKIGRLSCCYWR